MVSSTYRDAAPRDSRSAKVQALLGRLISGGSWPYRVLLLEMPRSDQLDSQGELPCAQRRQSRRRWLDRPRARYGRTAPPCRHSSTPAEMRRATAARQRGGGLDAEGVRVEAGRGRVFSGASGQLRVRRVSAVPCAQTTWFFSIAASLACWRTPPRPVRFFSFGAA